MPAASPGLVAGLLRAAAFGRAGVPLGERHLDLTRGKRLGERHLVLRAFVLAAAPLALGRAHQELAGGKRHHFGAVWAVPEIALRSIGRGLAVPGKRCRGKKHERNENCNGTYHTASVRLSPSRPQLEHAGGSKGGGGIRQPRTRAKARRPHVAGASMTEVCSLFCIVRSRQFYGKKVA